MDPMLMRQGRQQRLADEEEQQPEKIDRQTQRYKDDESREKRTLQFVPEGGFIAHRRCSGIRSGSAGQTPCFQRRKEFTIMIRVQPIIKKVKKVFRPPTQ